ncbi:hypothetical protein V5O48_015604 [Marasmius crinis-equi]|uniref:Glutamine amidotransferase type-2 domain-containing protein n=1 Tax=Marasmius crinis-equi TaxID=585013 RepID=A0ABR3EU27_9AGAR
MCGISGLQASVTNGTGDSDGELEGRLSESIKAMKHRGPDSEGVYVDESGSVGLAHARLAVIDLEDGQQPLHEGTIHAVVNGEFYDYPLIREDLEQKGCIFKSSVDSELVVHLYKIYGENLLEHLRGEFAFILYDEQRRSLFAARDRFGCKPLFYTISEGGLMLASEMKALLPLGWKPEWDLQSLVQMGDYNDRRTVFKGVHKLPPGHQLTSHGGRVKIMPYWDNSYPDSSVEESRPIEEMIEGVRSRLVDAVKARLRSDVPLGVYLSGGIDSAATAGITASLLKEQDPNARLTTFTLSFPARPDLDEGPIARRMGELIDADIHMITPTEEQIINNFEKSVYHSEQPVTAFHGAGKLILAEYVRNLGVKVVLTGEGADEVFGGYSYLLLDYLRAIDPAAAPLGIPLPTPSENAAILDVMQGQKPAQDHGSMRDIPSASEPVSSVVLGNLSTLRSWAALSPSPATFREEVLDSVGPTDYLLTIAEGLRPEARENIASGRWHPLHSGMYTITNTMLANLLLNIVGDRVEMAASIEGRQPFLDHQLAEYVNQLPPSVKVKPCPIPENGTSHSSKNESGSLPRKWTFTEKWILREAAKPYVTDEVYRRKKAQYNVPLSVPTSSSLSPLQRLLKTRLTEENIAKLGWLNWEYISGLLDAYIKAPECPLDGGLDKRARVLLFILSFVVLQERFQVPRVNVRRRP